MAKKSGTTTHHRSAEDGRYVSEKYAEKHPRTTVKETDKRKPPEKKK